ncbi:hypothetical protein RRG08_042276 [Elysia crispata]|uniref:Uncharacterized protein n=1 Tax=Elysia crispata TaxID=231223 RepID=A0AAE1AHY3_9GAST|nr:hypothetical protein RRG08_042276 [Elysia crispata]
MEERQPKKPGVTPAVPLTVITVSGSPQLRSKRGEVSRPVAALWNLISQEWGTQPHAPRLSSSWHRLPISHSSTASHRLHHCYMRTVSRLAEGKTEEKHDGTEGEWERFHPLLLLSHPP